MRGGRHSFDPRHSRRVAATPDSTVHFVSDGIESAVDQAKAAADGKSVAVHGADTIQQCLDAGLLDEINVDLAAVLLGSGVRLFDHLEHAQATLGSPTVIAGSQCGRYRTATVAARSPLPRTAPPPIRPI